MKIICVGDIHFKVSNYKGDFLFCRSVVRFAQRHKPDAIVLMGDVLDQHEKIHVSPFNLACRLIRRLRLIAPVFVLVGNHDFANNTEFQSENHWMLPLKHWSKRVHIIDKAQIMSVCGVQFTFCPYVFPGRFQEALDSAGAWRTSAAVFAHQEIRGVKMGAFVSVVGDEWDADAPLLISGHIHERQQLRANVYYTGSSKPVSFGDDTHGLTTLEIADGEMTVEHHELKDIPRKVSLTCDLGDIASFDLECAAHDEVRLKVLGTTEEFKVFKKTACYKNLMKRGVKVALRLRGAHIVDEAAVTTQSGLSFLKALQEAIAREDNAELKQTFDAIISA